MVRKKRKGVIKETQADGAALSPSGVDLGHFTDQVPLNVTLPIGLGGGDLAQWYEVLCTAKGNLYDQLKQLQLLRSKCKLTGVDLHLKTAMWPLFFRLSVAETAQPLRKNLGLILDVLAQNEDSSSALRIVAATELSRFLDTLWIESKAEKQTPERRVVLLDQMLQVVESPFLARILVENPVVGSQTGDAKHLLQFVTQCADHLEAMGAPILEYHDTNQASKFKETQEESEVATASTNVVLIASERCGHALKSVIVLTTMKNILDRRLGQCRGICLENMVEAFLRILKHCVLLLKTRVVHKDLLTQAGLAYCLVFRLLLRLSVHASEASSLVTKLLLQTAYPELNIVSLSTCGNSQLRSHVEKDLKSLDNLSRLTVYRGLLNSFSNDDLALSGKTFGLKDKDLKVERSVLDTIFTSVQHFCKHEAYNTRLYAFQVLEAFLRRAILILQNQQQQAAGISGIPLVSVDSLTNLTTAVLLNWEHPSKKVNQFMAVVFSHIVNYFVLSGGFNEWSAAILPQLVELPFTSRAKYGSLTALVGEAGAKPVLQASPQLLSSLLLAVGQKDYAAPAAANLFARILDDLCLNQTKMKESKPDDDARHLWLPNFVSVLLSSDTNLRSRVAMYLIPLLLKKDPDCMPVLIQHLQERGRTDKEVVDVALWAELEVLKFARKKMAPEKLIGLSLDGIQRGLCHAKAETRGTAFDALCASLKSTSMPSDEELRLLKYYLVVNGKEIDPAGRMSTLIGLKTVLIRIKETLRITSRFLAKENSSASAHETTVRDDYASAVSFKHWIELFIVASVYPGALPSRLTLGLEIFLLYVQLFGFGNDNDTSQPRSLLLTGQMVTTLLYMLLSAWDAIRSLAFTIMDLYPDELPSYSTQSKLCTLVNWAVGLCGSPRQRESDAGAMFIRLLFQKCSSSMQRYGITFQSVLNSQSEVNQSVNCNPEVAFVLQLTQVISSRVQALSLAEIQRGKSPLVHGFLLSLQYVLENVAFDQLSDSDAVEWTQAMKKIFTAVHQSMKASLAVVGDAASGAGDEPLSGSFAGVVGEVSAVAKPSSSALRVDCRGHLIIENRSHSDRGEKEDGEDTEQRAVVDSWLTARACGAILELLMKRVPLPERNPSSNRIPFFTVDMAQRGGETLLNSLFELKHKGAVATAYQAFEGVCRAFLAHAERNPLLGSLPARWADRLLDRLERSEQHFILRRSSGFAFSFVAILRAEPRNSAAVILPKVMTTLLRLAGEDTDAAEKRATHEAHHLLWRARVHALNILKLICEDGVLAEDVARYVIDMFELAVRGFECGSWAVRNSSMMLFAAATQRAIGDKRIADGRSCKQIASDDVFSRFQTLRDFLVRELTRLIENESNATTTFAASPGLYPLLLFLSRLRPSDEDEEEGGLASFVPLVMKCAFQPTMAIRHMAANVLASIVSDAEAATVLSLLCSNLPQGVRRTSDDSTCTKGRSHNAVHGVLVQIRYLVTKHLAVKDERRNTTKDTQAQIVEICVTKLLPSTMWLWAGINAGLINAAIRAEIVATLDTVVHYFANDSTQALSMFKSGSMKETLLQFVPQIEAEVERQVQQRCDMEQAAAVRLSTQPGMYVLDRALVSIWFSLRSLRDSNQLATMLLKEMLASKVLQIRKKSIKQLSKEDVIGKMSSDAIAELQITLVEQFLVETDPKMRARQLQLLIHCQLSHAIADTHSLRSQLQAQLTRIFSASADTHVLAPAFELFALMMSNQHCDKESEIALYQTMCHQIELWSDEKQPLVLRQAAASAIHHSDLLRLHINKDGNNLCGSLALAGWMSALRLLQDDNLRVRAVARQAIQQVLDAVDSASRKDPLSDATVLSLAVEYVTASFAHCDYGAPTFLKVLIQLIDANSVLTTYAGATTRDGEDLDFNRRIFETESSNYFAERDVLAQNMVYSLFARSNAVEESICSLRRQILALVGSALDTLNQQARGSGAESGRCLGNITYYPDMFAPLFGLCAAGVAIVTTMPSLLTDELQGLVSHVCEAAQEAHDLFNNDGVTHPLLLLALELLANKDQHKLKQGSMKLVRELLYLTPHWTALARSMCSREL